MKGEGDGQRNKIFANAFGRDPQFFGFYRAMQSYEKALIGGDTSLILSPDSDFFKFFGKTGVIKNSKNRGMKEFIIAIGLVLFIEGLLCALFPSKIKNMSKLIENMSANNLRKIGTIFTLIGFIIIWYIKR